MIKTETLEFSYDSTIIFHFPDIDLPSGSILLLTGPSGCGKSTWLALTAGLIKPSSGHMYVAGQNMSTLHALQTDAWRAKTIGFLPQKLHLSPALTVEKNLALAQWAAGLAYQANVIKTTLESLDIANLAKRYPNEISGGQAQRVALARAVVLSPALILADEPTASLDDESAKAAIELLLKTAHQKKAGLIIATHDSRVAQFIQQHRFNEQKLYELKLQKPDLASLRTEAMK